MSPPVTAPHGVTKNNRGPGLTAGSLVWVSTERFRLLMEMTGTTNQRLADAVGRSKGYVGQVRSGGRVRVARAFLLSAGDYLGRVLGETGRVAMALITEEPEDNAGGKDEPLKNEAFVYPNPEEVD